MLLLQDSLLHSWQSNRPLKDKSHFYGFDFIRKISNEKKKKQYSESTYVYVLALLKQSMHTRRPFNCVVKAVLGNGLIGAGKVLCVTQFMHK